MLCNTMILYVEVTNIGWTLGGAPIRLVCSTDSVSRPTNKKASLKAGHLHVKANPVILKVRVKQDSLYLRWRTHNCSVIQ